MGTEYEGRKLDLEELLELSEGDSLQICYGSVYAETPQTIEAGVAAVDVHESRTSEVTWFDVLLDLGEREERLRSRKRGDLPRSREYPEDRWNDRRHQWVG